MLTNFLTKKLGVVVILLVFSALCGTQVAYAGIEESWEDWETHFLEDNEGWTWTGDETALKNWWKGNFGVDLDNISMEYENYCQWRDHVIEHQGGNPMEGSSPVGNLALPISALLLAYGATTYLLYRRKKQNA